MKLLACWRWLLAATALPLSNADGETKIEFQTERAGHVSISVYRLDGTLLHPLVAQQKIAAGSHDLRWDEHDARGIRVPAGDYEWRGLFQTGAEFQLPAEPAKAGSPPWLANEADGGWMDAAGVPSAVAADATQIYLGRSLAEQGSAVVASDLEGKVVWAHRRPEGPSGCAALAADGGLVFVLGGLAGIDAEGGAIYRLNPEDGRPMPWPNGALDLRIAALWPADARSRPPKADSMAVRHGRIYLTFTRSQFLAVLDSETGAYLQTVVGAPPGFIDVAPTKSDLPDAPGKLVDADFAVISLARGVLGKVLFAHDPPWVLTSEMTHIAGLAPVTALSVVGDGAAHHRHTAFVGVGAPTHQVQARPLLAMGEVSWSAGKSGGRALSGSWQPDGLLAISSVATDASGRLWIAEGDPFPQRFSVWERNGVDGKLLREHFGAPWTATSDLAIHPSDSEVFVARSCEWRFDRASGKLRCLGTIAREKLAHAIYAKDEVGRVFLLTSATEGATEMRVFERISDSDFRERTNSPGESRADQLLGGRITVPASR